MSEMTPVEMARRALELDPLGSPGPWHIFGNTLYLRKVSSENPGQESVDYYVFPGNQITAKLIAEYRSICPAIAKELLKYHTAILNALEDLTSPMKDDPSLGGNRAVKALMKVLESP